MVARSALGWVAGWAALAAIGCGNDSPQSGPTITGDGQTVTDLGSTDATIDADADADTGTDACKAAIDGGPSPAQVAGIGKACLAKADCAADLFCQELNAVTGQGICTKACKAAADCPGGSHCNPQGAAMICTLARYCNACTCDGDCSSDAPLCLKDKNGQGFCTMTCTIGDGKCGAGSSCVAFGEKLTEFACRPDYGSCKGGGEHCSPCATVGDCGPGSECYLAKSGERFCAQLCDPKAAPSCPKGFACAAAGNKGYCFRQAKDDEGKDTLVPTCAKGDKGYCDACNANYECASGKCASKNEKKFCALPGTCTQQTQAADCPYGGKATFCVPTNIGLTCAPPPAWHCTGYKQCLGFPCAASEICDNGICKPKPASP